MRDELRFLALTVLSLLVTYVVGLGVLEILKVLTEGIL